jgi:hypothetical protein
MNNLNGFLGVEFGSSIETTKEKLQDRFGGNLNVNSSDSDYLFYDLITFGGRQSEYLLLSFLDDKFAKATVMIKPKLESKIIETYKAIKKEINEKYFISLKDYELYDYPYEKNDGHTESGISLGKVTFSTYWNFQNSDLEEDCIAVEITEDLEIRISYENSDLITQIINRHNQKNSLDY